MKNRVPASGKAGYVNLKTDSAMMSVDSDGYLVIGDMSSITGKITHADNATQEGSLYNVANVLPVDVCSLLGISTSTSEPKDAFVAINNKAKAAQENVATLPVGNWVKDATYRVESPYDTVYRQAFSSTNDNLGARAVLLDFTANVSRAQDIEINLTIELALNSGGTASFTIPKSFGIYAASADVDYKFSCEIWIDGGLVLCRTPSWFGCIESRKCTIKKIAKASGDTVYACDVWKKV